MQRRLTAGRTVRRFYRDRQIRPMAGAKEQRKIWQEIFKEKQQRIY